MIANFNAIVWIPNGLVWFLESVANAAGSFMPGADHALHEDAIARSGHVQRDEKVFLQALDENQGILTKVSRSYSNRRVDREDLYAEIVYQLWKAFPTYNGDSKIGTWMYTIALRTAMMPFRHVRPAEELQENMPDIPADEAPEADDRLFLIIHRLGQFERATLALMLEGYSQREIAVMLNLSEWTVNKRLSRARKIIKEHKTQNQ